MEVSDTVIELQNVSKRYERRARTLRGSLAQLLGRGGQRGTAAERRGEFWAVRDLSFAVRRGETLGIIGPNGAGKSTVLKMIAGITAPTSGRITVKGRVGTLIELGAGFNPDLTGRENVYLNGAVLGLTRREIEERYDQIAAFSGLGEFLEGPVKYYSSGMYAKLGFAIAVYVEAEILLTDEVLAVGDAAFQQQCLEKFQELKASTTIVLVSHDLAMVEKICRRALWFKQGRLECEGEPRKVIDAYLESVHRDLSQGRTTGNLLGSDLRAQRWGSGEIEIVEIITCNGHGEPRTVFRTLDELVVRIHYQVKGPSRDPGFCVNICTEEDVFLHGTNTFNQGVPVKIAQDTGIIEVHYPRLPLMVGTYWLTVGVTSDNNWTAPYDLCLRVKKFEVLRTSPEGGAVCFDHSWRNCV
ncbi:ABC transporter ATP-binding protein [Nitrospiraceae bacterium AH_259_D15_M11_P09]|nr:ABC transporter ATP-binding protein [Nitrospiraceae bacterium AH_259_D15_M11_P09]